MALHKLLLTFIVALALTGCGSKSWNWFFGDNEEVEEVVYEDEIEEEWEDEDLYGESEEEIVYVYVDEDGNELYREVVSANDEMSEKNNRRLHYAQDDMMDEEAMPPSRRSEGAMQERPSGRRGMASEEPEHNIVRFDYKKTRLSGQNMRILEEHASYLQENPDLIITIEGHTDSVASRDYNKRLGLQRAQMVADLLEEMGASSAQMVTVSYGEERPLREGDSERTHEMNRRVELVY